MKPLLASLWLVAVPLVAAADPDGRPKRPAKVVIETPAVEIRTNRLALAGPARPYVYYSATPIPMTVERRASTLGANELSARTGIQVGLGGTTPGGVKLLFDYARRINDVAWLDFKLNPSFAAGGVRGTCFDGFGRPYDCSGFSVGNGQAIDALAGLRLRFPWRRLVPFADLTGGVVGIYGRPQNDNGVAAVVRAGGGLDFMITPRFGLGGEMQLTGGPVFYNGHNELYRAIDLALGAQLLL